MNPTNPNDNAANADFNWNRYIDPLSCFFANREEFVLPTNGEELDALGPYAAEPCGPAQAVINYVTMLEERCAALAAAGTSNKTLDELLSAHDCSIPREMYWELKTLLEKAGKK